MKKRPDGRWVKAVNINGKRKYFYSTAETERQAEKDISRQMLIYNAETHKSRHNFYKLAEQMLDARSNKISVSTLKSYKYALLHFDKFYDMDIEDITPAMVQAALNEMSLQQYSQSAIAKAKIIFGLVLDYAIMCGLPIVNYMHSVKTPYAPRAKINAPADDVILKIKNALDIDFGDFAAMLLFTGMRRGELVALQRRDVDLKKGVISVRRSVEYVSNQPTVKNMPKTINSIRNIPILDDLNPIISRLCKGLNAEDFIFGKEKPYTLIMLRRRWNKYVKAIGCESLNMHQLRHAYAGILFNAGVDAKTAQGLLGHADIKTTMNIYTDLSEYVVNKSTLKINEYLAKKF